MSFSAAGALLWLIPTAGVLFALYLLKMRRKPLKVPALFLWPRQVEEIRANSLFQRPRLNLLFWLQLLALLAVAAALAGPQWLTRSLTGKVTMVILDGSASMGATDISPSRFEEGRRLARQAIDELKPGDLLGVVYAGREPKVVIPLTGEPRRHLGRLDALQAQDAPCDMGAALRLAAASVGAFKGVRVLVLSDGAFGEVGDFRLANGDVVFRSIGKSSRNLGISALGSAQTARGEEVYCAVRNYGLDAATCELTLTADGRTLDARTLKIKGGATWGTSLVVPAGTRVCQARLEGDDWLKADNIRTELVGVGSKLRVLLVGPGDYFLEKALALDPRVTLERSPRLPAAERAGAAGNQSYDVVVFAGAPEAPVKARGVLTFGRPGESGIAAAQGTAEKPEHIATQSHPAVEGIEFGEVFVESLYKVRPRAGAKTLVEARQGPMVLAEESPGRRRLLVAFDLPKSDWPLRPGFPMFIGRALTFLAGTETADALSVAAGTPFTIPVDRGAAFQAPNDVVFSRQNDYAIIRGLPHTGSYTFSAGGKTLRAYANLLDADESRIDPSPILKLGGRTVDRTPVPERPTDLWQWAVLFTLVVLALEWWVFVRKS